MTESKQKDNKAFATHNVRHSANQNWRKCSGCGKFISYNEMQKDAICKFIPDTYFTEEKVEWLHKHCA